MINVGIYANTFNSTITIDTNDAKKGIVSNKIFGGFTEFLLDYINGPNGIWAQEFMDRGFDIAKKDYSTSIYWDTLINDTKLYELYIKSGGYNENGKFYQHIKNDEENGEIGIYQLITYDDTTHLDVYAYFKTKDANTRAVVKILDEDFNLLNKYSILDLNESWQKRTFKIEKIQGYAKVIVYFGIEGKGQLSIDEASAMPGNNVRGIRKEYFDLFKNWNMGTLRWPGGCFADYWTTRWMFSIGDIDKREAPLYGDQNYKQRMDFGLHEYMWLCDTLNIEPYLTTNFRTGTIEEAKNWVKYCNYDTTDFYGKMRYLNGSLKPFDVKYWEIGNEQWYYGSAYAVGYVPFYDSLYKIDSNIKFILATDVWPGKTYFDSTMNIVGDKANIYGYHPILFTTPEIPVTDNEIYLNTVSLPSNYQHIMWELNKWLKERNLDKKIKQGSTEWGYGYSNFPGLLYDTIKRASSLEAGLFYGGKIMSYIRAAEFLHMSNVTMGYGFIRRGYDSVTKKRSIVGAPSYQMLALLSRHFGEDLLNISLECPLYSSREMPGFWATFQKPWLDLAVTKSKDSIFLAVINKHPTDTSLTFININNDYTPDTVVVHQISSANYLDASTFENPNYILPKRYKIKYDGTFKFPKHSLTILAIPLNFVKLPNDTNNSDTTNLVNEFLIYPNPANKLLNIEFDNNLYNFIDLTIFDIKGGNYNPKIKNISNNKIIVDIAELKTGKYYIRFTGSKKSITKEFFVMP